MATGKRYYWIKLKDSFFADDGPVDFLMSQDCGANYVVLYEMLCLKTINTNGRLSNKIGEILIPYDMEKIRRTCKYFSIDTIRIALKLYQALGLIYEDRHGILVISDYKRMVGSETDWASQKQRQRMKGSNGTSLPAPPPKPDRLMDKSADEAADIDADNVHIEEPKAMDNSMDAGSDTAMDISVGMNMDKSADATADNGADADADNVHIEIKRLRDKEIKSLENREINLNNNTGRRNKSVSQTTTRASAHEDGQTDSELQSILENCELEIFEPSLRTVFTDAIERLYYSDGLRVGNALLPQDRVRSRLHLLNDLMLQDVQRKMETNTTPIKNPTAYIMTVIYTTITEYESSVLVAPELHDTNGEE